MHSDMYMYMYIHWAWVQTQYVQYVHVIALQAL